FVASVKTQINAVSTVLITLITSAGASSSAGVYTTTVAVLGGGMTSVITYLAFPALLMALVFDIIGSVSTGIKLGKTAEFFRSACKWFLGTAFFLFIAVIGVSGITASVRDGISVRAARFAVSKYVPVIGGYLSQGFDFVMAGNVLIKNALGSSAVVLIILCAAPVISKLAVFTLTLKLTAAIAEPLGGDRFGSVLTSVSKSSSMIATVVIAMTFLYVLFLSMIICTGNIGL
ncbi:MAG: stage III sporulation protein AE, partial [Clostridiales bacterium]|nr:stage III sporulation protein AE [Clostridiales bacterium]